MISMNISPPRLKAARKLARMPAVKARILNSCSRNIGWGTLVSITLNATSRATPEKRQASTKGLVHPIVSFRYGSIPYVMPTMTSTSPAAKVMFPGQSILAGRRSLNSRSFR
jgi:hypothetical protein